MAYLNTESNDCKNKKSFFFTPKYKLARIQVNSHKSDKRLDENFLKKQIAKIRGCKRTRENAARIFIFLVTIQAYYGRSTVRLAQYSYDYLTKGQAAISFSMLADFFGLSLQNVRTALKALTDAGLISTERTRRGSIVTILEYDRLHTGEIDRTKEYEEAIALLRVDEEETLTIFQDDYDGDLEEPTEEDYADFKRAEYRQMRKTNTPRKATIGINNTSSSSVFSEITSITSKEPIKAKDRFFFAKNPEFSGKVFDFSLKYTKKHGYPSTPEEKKEYAERLRDQFGLDAVRTCALSLQADAAKFPKTYLARIVAHTKHEPANYLLETAKGFWTKTRQVTRERAGQIKGVFAHYVHVVGTPNAQQSQQTLTAQAIDEALDTLTTSELKDRIRVYADYLARVKRFALFEEKPALPCVWFGTCQYTDEAIARYRNSYSRRAEMTTTQQAERQEIAQMPTAHRFDFTGLAAQKAVHDSPRPRPRPRPLTTITEPRQNAPEAPKRKEYTPLSQQDFEARRQAALAFLKGRN